MELYEVVANYARENGIERFEPQDITNEFLVEWATEYAENYSGTFSFMLDMKRDARMGDLSKGKVKGILNSALAEYRYRGPSQKPEERIVIQTAPQIIERVVPNGTYTAIFPDQSYRTIRISDDFRSDAPEGSQMAAFLSGSDNESDYTGFAFLQGDRVGVWRKYQNDSAIVKALYAVLEDHEAAGHAYAIQSGRCWNCNRPLTVPDSIHRGLGPVCAKNLGYA